MRSQIPLQRFLVVATALLLLLPHTASGQFTSSGQLSRVSAVQVSVADDLDNANCISNAYSLKAEAELVLQRSGIGVVDELRLHNNHRLLIGLSGFQIRQRLCVVHFELQLFRYERLLDSSRGLVLSFLTSGTLAGTGLDMMSRLRNSVNEAATVLANEILKARNN